MTTINLRSRANRHLGHCKAALLAENPLLDRQNCEVTLREQDVAAEAWSRRSDRQNVEPL